MISSFHQVSWRSCAIFSTDSFEHFGDRLRTFFNKLLLCSHVWNMEQQNITSLHGVRTLTFIFKQAGKISFQMLFVNGKLNWSFSCNVVFHSSTIIFFSIKQWYRHFFHQLGKYNDSKVVALWSYMFNVDSGIITDNSGLSISRLYIMTPSSYLSLHLVAES